MLVYKDNLTPNTTKHGASETKEIKTSHSGWKNKNIHVMNQFYEQKNL